MADDRALLTAIENRDLRIAVLEDQVRALKSSLSTGGCVTRPWGLTPQQYQIVSYMREKSPNFVNRHQVETMLYGLDPVDRPHSNSIAAQICLIRKLVPFEIGNQFGDGWRLDATAAAVWDGMLAK